MRHAWGKSKLQTDRKKLTEKNRTMKKLMTFLAVAFTITAFGQSLDGYKYVYVPTLKYTDGSYDTWSISSMSRTYLSNFGFIVLTESSGILDEIKKDPCLVLTCVTEHTTVVSGTSNRVTATLKNCKEEAVYASTGSAMGWSLQDDYNKATKRAWEDLKNISYSFNPSKTIAKQMLSNLPTLELTGLTEDSIKSYLTSKKLDPIEGIYKSYQSDDMPYYKFGIIKAGNIFKAVIIESEFTHWKQGEVKAIFEKSSMKGLYSTKWYNRDKTPFETFASMDNEAILIIELINSKSEKTQDKFIKLFPMASNDLTFKKDNSKSSGSGFFLTTEGVIATNAHVVEDATNIEVTVSNEVGIFAYKAKVLLVDTKNDVALLKIDDEKFKGLNSIPYGITENSDVGSKVFTIGYPLNDVMGSNYKVTDGIISSKSGIADDVRYYQISVPLQPGNSGGPLFNKEGNLIGITSARLNGQAVGTQIENVNYAIKSSYLLNLYNMLPNPTKLSTTSIVATKELQDQVKILKNYVCLIKIF